MMDQNFALRFWFLELFEIFKKASRGPSAADLDHYGRGQTRSEYRVLVTKFRQKRLTLKGRIAGQRQTDRQTRLKIMALQVCNEPTDTETRVTTMHFSWSTTHAKCDKCHTRWQECSFFFPYLYTIIMCRSHYVRQTMRSVWYFISLVSESYGHFLKLLSDNCV